MASPSFRARFIPGLRRLVSDRRGAAAVEYGLVVALIAGAVVAAFLALGGNLGDLYGDVAEQTTSATQNTPDDGEDDTDDDGPPLLEVVDVSVSFDVDTGQFAVSGPGGRSQHDTLDSAVEGVASAFGGETTRRGSLNAQRIANGRAPNGVRTDSSDRLIISGRSIGGQYRFDFGSASDASNAQSAVNQLFQQVGSGGLVASGDR